MRDERSDGPPHPSSLLLSVGRWCITCLPAGLVWWCLTYRSHLYTLYIMLQRWRVTFALSCSALSLWPAALSENLTTFHFWLPACKNFCCAQWIGREDETLARMMRMMRPEPSSSQMTARHPMQWQIDFLIPFLPFILSGRRTTTCG